MADDDKQVEIEIALRDTASQTLRMISREIDNITRKLVETGRRGNEAFDSLKRKGGEAGGGAERASHGVDQFSKSISGLTKSLSGPLGLAAAFLAVGKSLTNFAQHRVELSLLTTDLGLTLSKIGEIKQILARKGLSEDAAKQFITGIAGQLQDLRVRDVYSDFYRRLGIYSLTAADDKFTEGLMKSAKSGNIDEAFESIIQHIQKLLSQGEVGQLRARYFAREVLGQNLSSFTEWEEMRKNLVKTYKVNDEEAKKAHREAADLAQTGANIKKWFVDQIIQQLNRLDKAYKDSVAPKLNNPPATGTPAPGGTPATPAPPDTFKDRFGPGGSSPDITVHPQKRSDLGTSDATDFSSQSRRGGVAKALTDIEPVEKETNRTLTSIRDTLQDLTNKPPGSGSPGLVASLGGSATSRSGATSPGSTTAPSGGGRSGGAATSVGAIGALGGTVHGWPVDAYGGLTGKTLYDPMTATSLQGGLGGHSAKFGPGHHEGLDIMGPVGSKVHAIQDGTVIRAPQRGHGNDQVMIIRHTDGTYTRYLHQSWSPNTVAGGKVSGGQQVGVSGHRNADHSHVEVWVGPPGTRGSKLVNLRAVMGYSGKNLPVGGTPRTGRGPGDNAPQVPTAAPPSLGIPVPKGRPADGIPVPRSRPDGTPVTNVEPKGAPAVPPVVGTTAWVNEQQSRLAGTRKGALSAQTRAFLEAAGAEHGLRADVYSGGQRMHGAPGAVGSHRHDKGGAADLKLYDPELKRYLDSRNPEDKKRMQAYIASAVRYGATGVGHGSRYMGTQSIHIGGGRRAAWGKGANTEIARRGLEEGMAARRGLDKQLARGRQSSRRDGNVKATVDFAAMKKVREAGEIFMPVRNASFSQGTTVHRNAVLPGNSDYSRWTA